MSLFLLFMILAAGVAGLSLLIEIPKWLNAFAMLVALAVIFIGVRIPG